MVTTFYTCANSTQNRPLCHTCVTTVFKQNTEPSTVYAEYIAEAIVARLNGQELTRPQRNLLNFALSSSVVRDTISDLMQKKINVVDSAQAVFLFLGRELT